MIWRFQSRCSSKITPRYLTLLQMLIFCPLILKFRCFVICFCLGLKIIISVLLVLRLILFARSHRRIKARSWFTDWIVLPLTLIDFLSCHSHLWSSNSPYWFWDPLEEYDCEHHFHLYSVLWLTFSKDNCYWCTIYY